MSYSHMWGEKDFDWDSLYKAIHYLDKQLKFWLIPVRDIKEKFGQLRCYCQLGWTSIHDLTHPGHAYIRYRKDGLLYRLNYSLIVNQVFHWLNYIVVPFHKWAYHRAYAKTVAKFPHLRGEITLAADYVELLQDLVPEECQIDP